MTNSKKNSKSIIALVVMALLLVASIVLAATGAWFTHKAEGDKQDFTFGKIQIAFGADNAYTLDEKADLTAKVMPGCTIAFNGSVENKEEAAYVAVFVEATLPEGLTWADLGVTDPSTAKVYTLAKGASQAIEATVTIPTTVSDQTKLGGKVVSFKVSAYAIQQDHYTLTGADDATKAAAIKTLATA